MSPKWKHLKFEEGQFLVVSWVNHLLNADEAYDVDVDGDADTDGSNNDDDEDAGWWFIAHSSFCGMRLLSMSVKRVSIWGCVLLGLFVYFFILTYACCAFRDEPESVKS